MTNHYAEDLNTVLKLIEETETGPFIAAVLDLVRGVTKTHRSDADGNCWADGCRDQYEEFMTAFPCRHWLDAQRVAVAWLYGRTLDSLAEVEDPARVAARERKRRQREREADSPVKANGNPSAKGSRNPSGNRVTTTSPEGPFLEEPQLDESRPSGQERDSLRDTASGPIAQPIAQPIGDRSQTDRSGEPLPTSTKLSETSAGLA